PLLSLVYKSLPPDQTLPYSHSLLECTQRFGPTFSAACPNASAPAHPSVRASPDSFQIPPCSAPFAWMRDTLRPQSLQSVARQRPHRLLRSLLPAREAPPAPQPMPKNSLPSRTSRIRPRNPAAIATHRKSIRAPRPLIPRRRATSLAAPRSGP